MKRAVRPARRAMKGRERRKPDYTVQKWSQYLKTTRAAIPDPPPSKRPHSEALQLHIPRPSNLITRPIHSGGHGSLSRPAIGNLCYHRHQHATVYPAGTSRQHTATSSAQPPGWEQVAYTKMGCQDSKSSYGVHS